MTIWERVKSALSTLTIPVSEGINLQATGASTPTEKPAEFITFALISSNPVQHADDEEKIRSHRVQVSYFNQTGLTGIPDISSLMTAAGFTRGPMTEIPYDPADGYFGVALEYVYSESEE